MRRDRGRVVIRLVLVAHSRLYREGLRHCLAEYPDLVLAAMGGEAGELPLLVEQHKPHVVLVDFVLEGALEHVEMLTDRCGGPRVLVLSVAEEPSAVIACARAGATGFVSKDAPVSTLATAIEEATGGGFAASPRVCGWLIEELRRTSRALVGSASPDCLTLRETETLRLMACGLSNREIAVRLGIGLSTVKNHVHHILEKLNVRRRGEAVACLQKREHELSA